MQIKGKKQKSTRRNKQVASRRLALFQSSPFPRSRSIKLHYSESIVLLETVVGSGAQQIWNLNSLFDPNSTGVGHQPLYYDQLFSITGPYQRYTVHTVLMKITATNVSASPALVAVYFQPGVIDLPGKDAVMEKPLVKWFCLAPAGGAPIVRSVTVRVPIDALFGVSRSKLMNDDQYSGFYNSSPAQIAYGYTMAFSQGGTLANVVVNHNFEYYGRAFGVSAASQS